MSLHTSRLPPLCLFGLWSSKRTLKYLCFEMCPITDDVFVILWPPAAGRRARRPYLCLSCLRLFILSTGFTDFNQFPPVVVDRQSSLAPVICRLTHLTHDKRVQLKFYCMSPIHTGSCLITLNHKEPERIESLCIDLCVQHAAGDVSPDFQWNLCSDTHAHTQTVEVRSASRVFGPGPDMVRSSSVNTCVSTFSRHFVLVNNSNWSEYSCPTTQPVSDIMT